MGNSYSEDKLMHIFLDNFHQGGKYITQIESHQSELRRGGKFTDQKIYLFHLYRLITEILIVVQVLVETTGEKILFRKKSLFVEVPTIL